MQHAYTEQAEPATLYSCTRSAAVATYGGDQALADARVQARAERFAPPPPQAAAASRELCERLAAVEVRQGEMRSMLVVLARVGAPGTPSSSSASASSSTSSSSSSSSSSTSGGDETPQVSAGRRGRAAGRRQRSGDWRQRRRRSEQMRRN
jgi:hypothetical protein